jgi:hypothetical protein
MRQDDRAVLEVQDTGIGISQPDGHDGHISVRPWTHSTCRCTAPRR